MRRALWAGLLLFLTLGPYFLWSSGYVARKAEDIINFGHRLMISVGFAVRDVVVEGRQLTTQQDILKILNVQRTDSIFRLLLPVLKQDLEKLPWVRSVTIQRHLPDILYIHLFERRPVALWQNAGTLYLVDDLGNIIENAVDYPQNELLVLTGEDAFKKANMLITLLKEFPDIYQRVTGALFIGKRRWDIILDHKLRLKLSEIEVKESLKAFTKLTQDLSLENKDVLGIDLRFKDRIYFQLSPEQMSQKKKIVGKTK